MSGSARSYASSNASAQSGITAATGGSSAPISHLPVFRFGDRVFLEMQTLRRQSGYLGLDDDTDSPMDHEMPPVRMSYHYCAAAAHNHCRSCCSCYP